MKKTILVFFLILSNINCIAENKIHNEYGDWKFNGGMRPGCEGNAIHPAISINSEKPKDKAYLTVRYDYNNKKNPYKIIMIFPNNISSIIEDQNIKQFIHYLSDNTTIDMIVDDIKYVFNIDGFKEAKNIFTNKCENELNQGNDNDQNISSNFTMPMWAHWQNTKTRK